jgi:WD40 repeat protein
VSEGARVTLGKHDADVLALAFTEDGLLLSGSKDRTARVWRGSTWVHVLGGHLESVLAVAQLAGGRIVTASEDCGVRIFEGASLVSLCKGHTSAVRAIAVAPSRRRFATASDDGSVRLWGEHGASGPVLRGHAEGAAAAWFTSETELVSLSRKGTSRTWNALSGEPVGKGRKASHVSRAHGPRVQLDEATIALGQDDGTVHLVRRKDRRTVVLSGHDDSVVSLALSRDSELLATGAADGAVHVWRWRDAWRAGARADRTAIPPLERMWSVKLASAPDTRFFEGLLWGGRGDELVAFDPESGAEVQSIHCTGDMVALGKKSVVFTEYQRKASVVDRKTGKVVLATELEGAYLRPYLVPVGKPLVWITRREGGLDHARLLDPETCTLTAVGPMRDASEVFVMRNDGARLVVAGRGPSAWVWDVATGELVTKLVWTGEGIPLHMAYTHDGARLVIGTRDGQALVFDAQTGELACALVPPNGERRYGWTPIKVSPASDRVLAWGGDNHHALLFDTTTGACLARIFGEEKSGYVSDGLAFSPDGTRIAAALSYKPKVAFYDGASGRLLATHSVHRTDGSSVAFRFHAAGGSGASTRALSWAVSSAIDRSIRAWDTTTGTRLWAHLGIGGDQIDFVSVSPRARFMAVTARESAIVRVVDMDNGRAIADLPGHLEHARQPTFSPDETRLATSSNDRVLSLWKLPARS